MRDTLHRDVWLTYRLHLKSSVRKNVCGLINSSDVSYCMLRPEYVISCSMLLDQGFGHCLNATRHPRPGMSRVRVLRYHEPLNAKYAESELVPKSKQRLTDLT